MCASSASSRFVGLSIERRPIEESESGRTGSGIGSPAALVARVLSVGYLPPSGKGKGFISKIRYPRGSEYLRDAVRYADAVGPSQVEPSYAKTFATRYGPPPSVRMWCLDLLMSYVVPILKMATSLRRPLRTVSASLCTPSSKASYSISMCAHPSSLPIFRASWSTFWPFSGIKASGSLL